MPDPAVLAFLHTAPPNIEMFRHLVAEIDPSVPTRHELIDSVLDDAVGAGVVTDAMSQQTEAAIRALVADGAALVVCTCSTIGGVAEATAVDGGVPVMRIDRPMAEAAVASGRRIVVAATLPSTLRPTIGLLQQVASEQRRRIDVEELLCADAWAYFQRGDLAGYAEAIASTVVAHAGPGDVVVLAQASMAPAAVVLAAKGVDAFASPERGVRAALDAYRRRISRQPDRP